MLKNTDLLFAKLMDYQNKRHAINSFYEQKKEALERFRGSKGFEEETAKNNQAHKAKVDELYAEYRTAFDNVLIAMHDRIGRRKITPPTNEELNLLSLLLMRKKPTEEEIERVAVSLKDNAMALSIVTDYAHDNDIQRNYEGLCPEMSSKSALSVVDTIRYELDDFLKYDTNRASRRVIDRNRNLYGDNGAVATKRKLFTTKEECYSELFGLDDEALRKFSDIVDSRD